MIFGQKCLSIQLHMPCQQWKDNPYYENLGTVNELQLFYNNPTAILPDDYENYINNVFESKPFNNDITIQVYITMPRIPVDTRCLM